MIEIPVHDPVLIFAIVMMLVLIAPIFAKKLKLPGIIGLITAGVIFGPHVLGLLERDKTIELLGTVGLLYIMFQAGLEIDLALVKKNKHYSLIFGILTFSIPLVLGTLAGYYFLNMKIASAVLLATMFSSHTLISFPIVSRLGITKKRAVSSTIGGTIITDTLALIILAVIIGSHHGELDARFWIQLISFSAIYAFLVILFLPIISRWFFHQFTDEHGIEEYVFVIAALFTCAYLAHLVGLEPIIGAFLAGLTMNSLIPEKSILMNRIQFVGDSLFIPFFLISVGMIINPSLIITDIFTLRVMATMVIIALFSKWMAAHLFGKFVSFNNNERNLMYGLSVNQAAATLAAVLVGYRVGIFEENVLTGTVIMIMITCFVGAIITEKFAKKIVIDTSEEAELKDKKRMQRVMVLINNPKNVNYLMDLAVLMHSGNKDEPLYPLNISIEGSDTEAQIIQGENLLTKAMTRAISANKAVVPLSKLDVNICNAINKSIQEYRISKVIMGWSENSNVLNHHAAKIIHQFIYQSNEMLVQARIQQPINLTKRMFLIFPPLINKQNGFYETLFSIKHLIHAINAKVTIFAEEETASEIQNTIFKQKPNISGEFHYITSWKAIYKDISNIISGHDSIMMLLSRPGRIAWQLRFERLPEHLKKQFPKHNLITVYPFFNTDDTSELEYLSQELTLLNSVPKNHFLFTDEQHTISDVLNEIITESDFRNPHEILRQLTATLIDSPIELSSEMLLLHIHTKEVTNYEIFIAKSKKAYELPENDFTPNVVFILLSPIDQPASKHLKILSEIARIAQVKGFVESIMQAENYIDFYQKMQQKAEEKQESTS